MSTTLPRAPAHYDQAQMQKILEQIENALGGCLKVGDTIVVGPATGGTAKTKLKFQAPNGTLYSETVDNSGTASFS